MSVRLPDKPRGAGSNAAFEMALSLHRQGQLAQAEQLYEAQLRTERHHFGALHNLALLRLQQGRLEEASAIVRKALRRNPKSAEAHNTLGSILYRMERHSDANRAFGRALALRPGFAEALNNRGAVFRAMNCIEEALACYQQAIQITPGYAAHHNLANALRACGRNEEAVEHFYRALNAAPTSAAVHRDLANTLEKLFRHNEAIDHYLAAIGLAPDDAELHYNLATALLALNRYEEARVNYERALALNPDYAEAHNNLASVWLALGRPTEAMGCLARSLTLAPNNAAAHTNRGQALLMLKRPAEAVEALELALKLEPNNVVARNNLGTGLRELGRYEEAIAHFEAALRVAAGNGQAHTNLESTQQEAGRVIEAITQPSIANVAVTHFHLGNLSAELGRTEEARQWLEKAVDLAPDRALFYLALADVKRFTSDDRHFAGMEALARDLATLSAQEQMFLHFALGKALADVGQHERAFTHQLQANAIKRLDFTDQQVATTLAKVDQIQATFSSDVIRSIRGVGDPSPVPVFIVGMPRSGTSLVEQILASHPGVFGAGELQVFGRLAASVAPDGLTRDWVRTLASRYLASIKALGPAAERITDKMPGNFHFIGLIHLALPNAAIIHTRRNPVDTCLSCFSKLFADEQPFAYDLRDLGRFYRAYERLMAHWRSVLPEGAMLEVNYEDIVADLEGQARRIVAHCGLDWYDGCLEFHKTERAVRTASVVQVRQPIYSSSVGRWRSYGQLLAPLFEALETDTSGLNSRGSSTS